MPIQFGTVAILGGTALAGTGGLLLWKRSRDKNRMIEGALDSAPEPPGVQPSSQVDFGPTAPPGITTSADVSATDTLQDEIDDLRRELEAEREAEAERESAAQTAEKVVQYQYAVNLANKSLSQLQGLLQDVEDAIAVELEVNPDADVSTLEREKALIQVKIDRRIDDRDALRAAARSNMASLVDDMNIPAKGSMEEIARWIKIHSNTFMERPSALDSWVLLHIEDMPAGASIKDALGLPTGWDVWEDLDLDVGISGAGISGLVQFQADRFQIATDWLKDAASDARTDAQQAYNEQKYALAMYQVGYYDWCKLAKEVIKDLWDYYQTFPQAIGINVDQHSQVVKTVMARMVNPGEFDFAPAVVPRNTGEDSPVEKYWNNGVWPIPIYLAGMTQASLDFYRAVIIGNWAWAGWNPGSDVPWWGDVDDDHWYYQY